MPIALVWLALVAVEDEAPLPAKGILVRGAVVAADTKKPLAEFRYVVGSPGDHGHTTWQGHLIRGAADGAFAWRSDNPWPKTRLRIEAAGFKPHATEALAIGSGRTDLKIALERDDGVRGTVVDAGGTPVAGADVRWSTRTWEATIEDGALRNAVDPRFPAPHARTDAKGEFRIAAECDPRLLVVAHPEKGFAVALPEEVASKPLALQPWSRVEGRWLEAGKPVPGAKVSLSGGRQPKPEWPVVSHWNRATADAEGKFAFARVAGGAGYLKRERDAQGGVAPWPPELVVPVGRTIRVTMGIGRTVRGRLFANQGSVDWRDYRLTASAEIGSSWKYPGPGAPVPADVSCDLDRKGNFELKHVLPGQYRLSFKTAAGEPTAMHAGRLSVPIAVDDPPDAPHDAGEVDAFVPKKKE